MQQKSLVASSVGYFRWIHNRVAEAHKIFNSHSNTFSHSWLFHRPLLQISLRGMFEFGDNNVNTESLLIAHSSSAAVVAAASVLVIDDRICNLVILVEKENKQNQMDLSAI